MPWAKKLRWRCKRGVFVSSIALTNLSSAFLPAREQTRECFINSFNAINDAQSKFFRHRFIQFLSISDIAPSEVPLRSILLGFYLHYILCSMHADHACLIISPDDDLSMRFILKLFPAKAIYVVNSKNSVSVLETRQHYHKVSKAGIETIFDHIPGRSVQQIVSLNTWAHDAALATNLAQKLAKATVLTTIVYNGRLEAPRSGPASRNLFDIQDQALIDISESTSAGQSLAAMSILHQKTAS
jgi:hypothetical protein